MIQILGAFTVNSVWNDKASIEYKQERQTTNTNLRNVTHIRCVLISGICPS